MEKLTEKQQRILRYIEGRLRNNDPPSQREIAQHFGLTQNAVYQLISYLKNKGYLTNSGAHRGLKFSAAYLERIKQSDGIPVIGTVAAGTPMLAEENIRGYINPAELFGQANNKFALKVTGNSMVDAGIMDGDFVLVEPASEIENGRIGVVLLNDEATVKKIYIRQNHIVLEPANKSAAYKTMYVKKGVADVRIIGKVTACFRKL